MDIPNHVAIIMDGNGRWAKSKGLPRLLGHKQGLDVAEKIILHAIDVGVRYLSLFVFSTENWKRPKAEVNHLFALADKYLSKFESFCANKVRIVVSGDKSALPKGLAAKIADIEGKTANFGKICVNLCLNYGGQREVVHAVNQLLEQNLPITVEGIRGNMYCNLPDPDLIVRTGGQKRLSNFLLFQSAYSELYFSDTLWPNFDNDEFDKIISEYQQRTRNFGGITDGK